jgi:DNA-binding IclR family transcriptional regulator
MAEAWHVSRTMRVLELLAFSPLSAPQVAAAVHAHPRTVRRVVNQLTDDGYLQCSDDGRRVYEPTMRLVALAGQVVDNSPLALRGRPFVELLQERTKSSAHLVVPSYDKVLCVVHRPQGGHCTARPHLRELVPAHATAGGKALLTHRDRWRESVLSRPLTRFTNTTITDPVVLRRELDQIRERGYATEDGELDERLRAAAASVFANGEAVAALSVSGADVDPGGVAAEVTRTAAELGSHLESR